MKIYEDNKGYKCFEEKEYIENRENSGRWLLYFDSSTDEHMIEYICRLSVEQGIVSKAAHTCFEITDMTGKGACVFYADIDSSECHSKLVSLLLSIITITDKNALVYVLDKNKRIGETFSPDMTIADIIDLDTGDYKI